MYNGCVFFTGSKVKRVCTVRIAQMNWYFKIESGEDREEGKG